MEDWQQALHFPTQTAGTFSDAFLEALRNAVGVVKPSLRGGDADSAFVLLFGQSGGGKSLLTRLLTEDVRTAVQEDGERFVLVELTGALHGTWAKAWRAIADAFATAFGSTPNATAENDGEGLGEGHYRDRLARTFEQLRGSGTGVLFVLDRFEGFVSGDGLSQTFLYTLFNVLQDHELRAACVAQTCVMDVTDMLEKRVASRFTHRKVVVPIVRDVDEVRTFIKSVVNASMATGDKKTRRAKGARRTRQQRELVMSVVANVVENEKFEEIVERQLARDVTMGPLVRAFDGGLSVALAADSVGMEVRRDGEKKVEKKVDLRFRARDCIAVMGDLLRADDGDMIGTMTPLQLSLLLGLHRAEAQQRARGTERPRVVFSDVYRVYETIGLKDVGLMAGGDADVERPVGRGVAEREWEELVHGGVVERIGGGERAARVVSSTIAAEVVRQALVEHQHATTWVKRWASGFAHLTAH